MNILLNKPVIFVRFKREFYISNSISFHVNKCSCHAIMEKKTEFMCCLFGEWDILKALFVN